MMKKYIKNATKDILGFLYYNSYLKYIQKPGNRVLTYHAFGSKLSHDTYGMSIKLNDFDDQLKFYKDNYNIINIQQYKNHGDDTLSITIDDGYKDNLEAVNILCKHDLPFTLYVTANTLDTRDYLSSSDIRSLSNLNNCEIASHSYDHIRLGTLDNQKILYQLTESKKVIEDIIGYSINGISYPSGSYNDYVVSTLASLGYEYAACSIKGKNDKDTNRFLLRRSEVIRSDTLPSITKKINGYYDFY